MAEARRPSTSAACAADSATTSTRASTTTSSGTRAGRPSGFEVPSPGARPREGARRNPRWYSPFRPMVGVAQLVELRASGPSARRRVSAVQHQVVAVGIGEESHVAHAGVERVAGERDAFALELRARGGDVLDVQREVAVLRGLERHALLLRLPDAEAGLADPELVSRVRVGAQAERLAVELARALGILRRDADEVELRDQAHACLLGGGRKSTR